MCFYEEEKKVGGKIGDQRMIWFLNFKNAKITTFNLTKVM